MSLLSNIKSSPILMIHSFPFLLNPVPSMVLFLLQLLISSVDGIRVLNESMA